MEDMKALQEDLNQYKQYLSERLDRWEQRNRQREAAQYIKMSRLERTIDDVLNTAILVFGGGMVILAAFAILMVG